MYRQGASVALTGITKAVAFLGPVIVLHIPALMDFCIVAAIAIFFELVLALFAFNACLVSGDHARTALLDHWIVFCHAKL